MLNLRPFYTAIKISGPESSNFLQGQLTCDITKLDPVKVTPSAHCNRKGRMVSLFLLCKHKADFYLIIPSAIAESALAELNKYVLRSKVNLAIDNELTITGYLDIQPEPQDLIFTVPGKRWLALGQGQAEADNNDINAWLERDIDNYMPWLTPETVGKFIPNEIKLDQHGGLSFDKGCYTGQEIIARLHYLGKSKKQLSQVNIKLSDETTVPGDIICSMEISNVYYGLAVLNIQLPKS